MAVNVELEAKMGFSPDFAAQARKIAGRQGEMLVGSVRNEVALTWGPGVTYLTIIMERNGNDFAW
ncbi:hypothetical protein CQ017_10940 [Arthrobacter sp. MYb224]|nr:hypothetical protein CQ017_10940 [Arthrobacter sp. MYb224]